MSQPPVLKDSQARKKSIIDNSPAIFNINDDQTLQGKAPFYEFDIASQVNTWCFLIVSLSKKHGVDPELTKAILYMETTHGWYDKFYPFRKTILPMNIHYKYWKDLGVTKEMLNCPAYNIEYGVILLSRIKARIVNPTNRKIASIYNFIGAERVTPYGAQVERILTNKPWLKRGCAA